MKQREKEWISDRDRKRIDKLLPILVPLAAGEESQRDGLVLSLAKRKEIGHECSDIAVKKFVPGNESVELAAKLKGFDLIAKLEALSESGEEVDYELKKDELNESLRSLVGDVCEPEFIDMVSSSVSKAPQDDRSHFSRVWLTMLGTWELKNARVVIWQPLTDPVGPAIYCRNAGIATFVSLFFSRMFSGIRSCLGCGRLFIPARLDQDYHDHRCAALHRKKRQQRRRGKGGN